MDKVKYYLTNIQTGSTPSTKVDLYYENGSVNWFTPGDFDGSKYLKLSSKKITELAVRDNNINLAPKNTLLIVGIGATLGKIAITQSKSYYNQQVTGISTKENLLVEYLYYNLLLMKDYIMNTATYTTLPIINNEFIKNRIKIEVPDVATQSKIVLFLNKKTFEIDNLISSKEKQIQLLEEHRQAMITETITKGLDSDAEKKESGIEWMGEIPKHWTITKIKYTTYVKGRIGWQGLRSEEFIDDGPYLVTGTDFDNGLINWNGCYHISENRYNEALPIQLKEDDLLITKDGTIGKIAMVKEMPDKAILNSGIFVTRPLRNQYHNNYMFWNLKSSSFSEYIKLLETGSTIKHLYQETFVNYSYALPPIDEQIEISNLLIKKNDEFDKLLLNIKKQLFKLNEYRQALIHEAVTGKIPVDEMEKYLKEVEEDGN